MGKVGRRAETHLLADLSQTKVGAGQQGLAFGNAAVEQVVDGRGVVLPLESVGKVVFVYVGDLGQLVQRDVLTEIFVNVPFGGGTLLALGRRLHDAHRHGGLPHDLDQQHFQNVLADHLAAVGAAVDLPQKHPHQKQQFLPHHAAGEHRVAQVLLIKKELRAVDTQHDVLQRVGLVAQLGMLHAGVDDDEVVRRHIEQLALDVELPAAADAEEHLGAGVGVWHAAPVAAEAAFADVQKAHRLPRGDLHVQIVPCIHCRALLSEFCKVLALKPQFI